MTDDGYRERARSRARCVLTLCRCRPAETRRTVLADCSPRWRSRILTGRWGAGGQGPGLRAKRTVTMDGATREAETWVGTIRESDHRIVGTGDYDSAGKADILGTTLPSMSACADLHSRAYRNGCSLRRHIGSIRAVSARLRLARLTRRPLSDAVGAPSEPRHRPNNHDLHARAPGEHSSSSRGAGTSFMTSAAGLDGRYAVVMHLH